MLIVLFIAVPIFVGLAIIWAALKFGYLAAFLGSIVATLYFVFLLAAMSGMGNPTGKVGAMRWAHHSQDILIFWLLCFAILMFLAFFKK